MLADRTEPEDDLQDGRKRIGGGLGQVFGDADGLGDRWQDQVRVAHGGEGDEDGAVVRQFAQSGMPLLIASSFSKSFSLYGERVGALTIIDSSKDESTRVLSQLKRVIRANYSTPPTHGGAVVTTVLTTPELRDSWVQELTEMRERIKHMRSALVDRLRAH